ncbi:MAG: CPBP family glutamic-type intramembrane protease [Pseudomonadota bacterium]
MFHWPGTEKWRNTLLISLAFAAVTTLFGLSTGLYALAPVPDDMPRRVAVAFIAPGLLEELAFRGPLLWLAGKRKHAPLWAIIISLSAFVAWHPVNATVYLKEAQMLFFDWRFLTVAAGLGAVATWLALHTRSIWPPILFHWLAVCGWIAFLGAPDFF